MLLALPPYGYMAEHFEDGAVARARPSQWKSEPQSWIPWFERVRDLISQEVWPIYRDGAWVSTPAAANAIDMTRADLDLMRDFRARHRLEFVAATGLYQAHLMTLEDGADWTPSIAACCPGLAAPSHNLDSVVKDGLISYLGPYTAQAFKASFQRPRPYQTAWLREPRKEFRRDVATSADTPALISGHAVQGLIVGCTILESIRADKTLVKRNREKLQAWMTGIGDRRVLAGVHYPTDSLASWIVAAEMVDHIFAYRGMRAFLVEAIRGSLLYRFLKARVQSTPAYHRPWKCLQATLAKPSSRLRSFSGTSDRARRSPAKRAFRG